MEPVSLATAIIGIIGTIVTVGVKVYGFHDSISSAAEEFNVFSREIAHFSSLWGLVQPYVDDPNPVISPACISTLSKVRDDVTIMFKDIQALLEAFRKKHKACLEAGPGNNFALPLASVGGLKIIESDREARFKKFFKKNQVTLLRSQLHHAIGLINAVLTVIQLPPPGSNAQTVRQSMENAELIVEQLMNSQQRLQRLENEVAGLSVHGTAWLGKLPDLRRVASPVEALHNRWVSSPITTPQGLRSYASISTESMSRLSHRLEIKLRDRIKLLEEAIDKQNRKLAEHNFQSQSINQLVEEAARWKKLARQESDSHAAAAAIRQQLANELNRSQQENENLREMHRQAANELKKNRQEAEGLRLVQQQATNELRRRRRENEALRTTLDGLDGNYNTVLQDNEYLREENARLKDQPFKHKRRLQELRLDRDNLQALCNQQQNLINTQNNGLYRAIMRIRKTSQSLSIDGLSRRRVRHRLDRLEFDLEDILHRRVAQPGGLWRFWKNIF